MSNILRLPGLIDIHVHLRDPGQTYKEDFLSGTRAALAGGITAVFDMPNNADPVFSKNILEEKLIIAGKKAVCDWGLYFGTDGRNTAEFGYAAGKTVGLKIYLSETTGKYLLEDKNLLENVFKTWPEEKVIVVHAEGDKISLSISLALKYGKKLHITHVSTKKDLTEIIQTKHKYKSLTCDVTPHHLFLTEADLAELNGFARVKPRLATSSDRQFLWDNLDKIDCIATDHAPHTVDEKKSLNPPFGVPGLETMLPLLLTAVSDGKIGVDDIIRLTNTNPQFIFGFRQESGNYLEVDTQEEYIIKNSDLQTKCGWTPFAGRKVKGKIKNVFLRGTKVYDNGKFITKPGDGKMIFTR